MEQSEIINKALYADAEEISLAIGKSVRTIIRMADHDKWVFLPEKTRSRHPKKWFLISKLPIDIAAKVIPYKDQLRKELHNEQKSKDVGHADSAEISEQANYAQDNRSADGRDSSNGASVNRLPAVVHGSGKGKTRRNDANVASPNYSELGGKLRAGVSSGAGDDDGNPINRPIASSQTGNAGPDHKSQLTGKSLVAIDSARPSGGDLVHGIHAGLPAGHRKSIKTTDKQREIDGARQYILNFIKHSGSKDDEAVIFINQGYSAGTLHADLVHAYEHCNAKAAKKVKPLTKRSVVRWRQLKTRDTSCLPKKTRVKADWRQVWWFQLFLSCYRKPQKPNVTEAYRDFKELWCAQGLVIDDLPKYDAVNRLLNKMPHIEREKYRRTGAEMAAMMSCKRRNWNDMASNTVWVGDGHTFKAKVINPKNGRAFAPEVTVIIDARSRFIVGWAFSLSENVIAVSEALGNAMLKYGKPIFYYSDNGSGQTAKQLDCKVGGLLGRMDISHETGIPGNPQGRGLIEGLWDITAIAAAKTFPTFQGTGMDRDTLRIVTNKINSAKRKGEVPDFVPDWHRFMATCEEYFDTYNHEHKHSSLGGKTPAEVYFANLNDEWNRPLTENEKINLYRPSEIRTPHRGEIDWINNKYFHKDLAYLPAKTKVMMSYDMHHADFVWVSHLNGEFICKAEWNGNMVDGFPKTLVDQKISQRIDGIVKRKQDGMDAANAERGHEIEGEVLQRIPTIPKEVIEPLQFVPVPAKTVEEPPKPVVFTNFSKQEPEEKTGSYMDTVMALYKNKGQ